MEATVKKDHFIKDPLSETEEEQMDYQITILEKRDAQIKKNFTPCALKPVDQLPKEIAFVQEIFKKDPLIQLYKSPFTQCLAENNGTLELNIALAMSKVKEKFIERFVQSIGRTHVDEDFDEKQDILYLKHKFSKEWSLNLDVDIEPFDKSKLITPIWSNISFTNFFQDVIEGSRVMNTGRDCYHGYPFTEVALSYFLEVVNAEPLAGLSLRKSKNTWKVNPCRLS